MIQRSRGYDWRDSLTVEEIGNIIKTVKHVSPETICIVDNCYGIFVETKEPTEFGADLIVGSLIKNAGGSLALSGGYIAGTAECVRKVGYRLTAPGLWQTCWSQSWHEQKHVPGSIYGSSYRL